jgi:hypothetical protein
MRDEDWIDLAQDREKWRFFCECIDELSGSIKCGEFVGKLSTCYLLRKDSATLSYLG